VQWYCPKITPFMDFSSLALKTEAVYSSETLVFTYRSVNTASQPRRPTSTYHDIIYTGGNVWKSFMSHHCCLSFICMDKCELFKEETALIRNWGRPQKYFCVVWTDTNHVKSTMLQMNGSRNAVVHLRELLTIRMAAEKAINVVRQLFVWTEICVTTTHYLC
jgi:hypothetical protein